METNAVTERRGHDLADHFLECSKMGGHLTVFDDSRFIITDDFTKGRVTHPIATAIAAIYSQDPLVALAAVVPLGGLALKGDSRLRRKYEELFSLIEEQALSNEVKFSAETLLKAGFQEARIRALEAELGSKMNPARQRYRTFLDVIRHLAEKKISATLFRDEFLAFTYAVAGRLDFGIYSFCLDRIFLHPLVPLLAKRFLVEEIMKFPPLVRRELIVNLLTAPGQMRELVQFVRRMVGNRLDAKALTEIRLLETLKMSRRSISQIENRLRSHAESETGVLAMGSA